MVVGSVKVNFSKKIDMKRNQLKSKESKEEKSRELQFKPKHQIYIQKVSFPSRFSLHYPQTLLPSKALQRDGFSDVCLWSVSKGWITAQ